MSTVALESQLMERLQQAASVQDVMPDELLETALRTYLRQLDREQINAEAEAYRSMHAELMRTYLGDCVAIHDGQVVDHDRDLQALHQRIRRRFGSQPVLLRRVEAEPDRVLTFRSPRFARGGS